MFHPSGAEGAIALAWAGIFTWVAAAVVFAISMIGSIVAGVQLKRRTGSTFNLVFAALLLAPSALWAVLLTVLFLSEIKKPTTDNVFFIVTPGVLMTAFTLSWFVLALVARLRRLTAQRNPV
jgi:hypothetical protein